ncbi:MAG: hypothetical protein ACOYOK_09225 [Pseudobdellovibrionaceae bacterium]
MKTLFLNTKKIILLIHLIGLFSLDVSVAAAANANDLSFTTITHPGYRGLPLLAGFAAATYEGSDPVSRFDLLARANVACQMAGYPSLAEGPLEEVLQRRWIVKEGTQVFDPLSLSVFSPNIQTSSQDFLFTREKNSHEPLEINNILLLTSHQEPETYKVTDIHPCAVAMHCRNTMPEQLVKDSPDLAHPIYSCTNWLAFGGRDRLRGLLVISSLRCAVDIQKTAQVREFHRTTNNRFHLDQRPVAEIGSRLSSLEQCETPLAWGHLKKPKSGDCDYVPWNKQERTLAAPLTIAPSAYLYRILTGRFRKLNPDAPQCVKVLVQDYAPLLIKNASHADKPDSLPFCVKGLQKIRNVESKDFIGCQIRVQAQDMLGQPTEVTLTQGVDLSVLASSMTRPQAQEQAHKICEGVMDCWQSQHISCDALKVCPPAGISNQTYNYPVNEE